MTDSSFRDANGRFTVGNPGGPGGARRRACELRRAAEDAVSPEHIQALLRKLLRMALEGNINAGRLVLERTCGRAAESPGGLEPLGLVLPRMRTAAECNAAVERVMSAFTQGVVDRDSTKVLLEALQTRLKAIELTDLETRLTDLEKSAQSIGTATGGSAPP